VSLAFVQATMAFDCNRCSRKVAGAYLSRTWLN
jgi:hypothetical protein